jgi:hypothetical protein
MAVTAIRGALTRGYCCGFARPGRTRGDGSRDFKNHSHSPLLTSG